MSDGGAESGRECEQQGGERKSLRCEFVQAMAKVAVTQICESIGFQVFQQSALNTLADVTVRYIHNVGMSANFHASLAGRTGSNVFDVVQALEALGFVQGYSGASGIDHCLANSGTIREIIQYVGEAEKIPYAHAIPLYPVVKDRKPIPSFLQIGEEPPDEHVPAWLPAFPDSQTYLQSSAWNGRALDTHLETSECTIQHRKTDGSLLNLQKQFVCNGSEGLTSLNPKEAAKAKQATESNPFLAPPLQFGEREVSQVVLPAKLSNDTTAKTHVLENQSVHNHVSVLETFAPAIEAMKSSLCNSEEGKKKVLLNQKPALQFKIRTGKKSLGTTPHLNPENKDVRKISPWFETDSEKDDKKRREDRILKESIQNPEELAQR